MILVIFISNTFSIMKTQELYLVYFIVNNTIHELYLYKAVILWILHHVTSLF